MFAGVPGRKYDKLPTVIAAVAGSTHTEARAFWLRIVVFTYVLTVLVKVTLIKAGGANVEAPVRPPTSTGP
jgi:hypothetical protein